MAVLERINIRDDINDPNFAADNELVFRATFSGDVNNVTIDDFVVTGTSGATIVNPLESVNNNSAQYDIIVRGANLSTFSGDVGIALAPTQNITDAVDSSAVPTAPPTGRNDSYTLGGGDQNGDTTPPNLLSIQRQDPVTEITDADGLGFRVTFDEAVLNVNVADFVVTGGTTATVTGFVQISDTVYDIIVTGGDLANFDGTVGLDLAANQNITDAAGNPLPAGDPATDETYTVSNNPNAAPELTSIERLVPASETTNSDTLVFRITFSQDVQNLDATDFIVNGGTTATVTSIVAVTNNSVYDITISGGDLATFNGSVNLALAANQNITNLANVAVPVAPPTGSNEVYTVTNDPADPALISIERLIPGSATTSDNSLVFQVTFNEGVQNVDAADFIVNGTTTAAITDVTAVSDSVYNITVSGGDLANFDGPVGLDLAATQDITDLEANALPAGEPATDESYTVSNTVQPQDGSLTPLGNILEITQLGIEQSLNLNISVSNITSVGDVTIFKTDANGNNPIVVGQFSVLEEGVLPVDYAPSFSLTESEIASGTFLQFEIVEKGVKSVATLTAISETDVSLEFDNGTTLVTSITDEAASDNLLINDAEAIDLTGLTGTSNITFTVYREAALDSTVGFYVADTADGGIITDDLTGATIRPGEVGYEAAVLANQLNVELTGQNNQVNTFDAVINNGSYLGIFVEVNAIDASVQNQLFYSYQGSNSDGIDHIKQVGTNTFGIEDIAGGGDRDFNDVVVEFEVAVI